jgi:tetratricopeptide (TPR) repeat protein
MSCAGAVTSRGADAARPKRKSLADARGVPLTAAGASTVDLFEVALLQYQTYVGDVVATLDEALARDPEFVLGHVMRATVLATLTERRFAEQARVNVASAEALLGQANERERGLVDAARHLVDGKWDAAGRAFDVVLADHPRDAFALLSGHLTDFYRGDAFVLRNRIARVLPHWSPSVPGYSYVLGMYAFGLEECNQYERAEDAGRRALELEKRDAWAVHAVTHVMEMQGRVEEGIAWLESREPDWAPENAFAFHNYWHLGLFLLDRQRYADVLAVYDRRIHASRPDAALQLLDATSLLFRLFLEGAPIGERAAALADNWAGRLDTERGFYAFNDMHAMMAFVMAGRDAEAERLVDDLAWAEEHAAGSNRGMSREVGLPVCRAIRAFGQGRYSDAIEGLQAVRDVAQRFGGSHAQRDVLTLTLIEAALRSDRRALARHYIAERTAEKPTSAWFWRLHARGAAS